MATIRVVALLPFVLALASCQPPPPPPSEAAATSAPAPKTQTIAVVEHATTDAVTDTGAKGNSAGDVLTFANEVFDAANEKKIGSDQGFCVRTAPGTSWECLWTLVLSDGQITVEGPFLDAGDSVLAVTGGTGAYQGAGGEMKLHSRDAKGTEYDFRYELAW
ncbi:MAG TPA: dirigent protein [Thermoanaerobaculia bacterium]|jgi:hypothetical protein|nr:dirigent protein [Thermoanaerobaculia bacterium]